MVAFVQSIALLVNELDVEIADRRLISRLSFITTGGDILRISGPNGSGKSTLLMALCGLYVDYSGDIVWKSVVPGSGEELGLDTLEDVLVFFSPKLGLDGALTPVENLQWYLSLGGNVSSDESVLSALDRAGVAKFMHQPVYSLSSGQQQRVKLARLFLMDKPLWILDEPFLALDHAAVVDFETVLIDHAAKGGTVIFTSHHKLERLEPTQTVALGSP